MLQHKLVCTALCIFEKFESSLKILCEIPLNKTDMHTFNCKTHFFVNIQFFSRILFLLEGPALRATDVTKKCG